MSGIVRNKEVRDFAIDLVQNLLCKGAELAINWFNSSKSMPTPQPTGGGTPPSLGDRASYPSAGGGGGSLWPVVVPLVVAGAGVLIGSSLTSKTKPKHKKRRRHKKTQETSPRVQAQDNSKKANRVNLDPTKKA